MPLKIFLLQKSEAEEIAAANPEYDDIAEHGDDDEDYNDLVEDEGEEEEGMMPPASKKAKVEVPDVVDDQDQVWL